ncbi:MAG TPA: Tn3 family transposase [Parachlamydiaceae bacterium]|nr:Tn3 family transposase [Parachlamydiaceae bacterium]
MVFSESALLQLLPKTPCLPKVKPWTPIKNMCLIKNAIVCWNYLYLSRELITEKNEERRAELIEAIRNGSAATWKHFNLHGEFDFSDERMVDSIGLALPKSFSMELV